MSDEKLKHPETIPEHPVYPYREDIVGQILNLADGYLKNAHRLIYSGGGRTFLSGYDIFDSERGNRGNIDCSTFLLLLLAGVPYNRSPYVTGNTLGLAGTAAPWSDPVLSDFSSLPESYRGIAEIIGRPDLVGDDGVDLEKARKSGIDWTAVHEEMARSGKIRRAHQMARYYWEKGACFTEERYLMPGDLVFFRATPKWEEGYRFFGIFREIAHVGIVSEDRQQMYNSSGYIDKDRNIRENRPAVSLDPVKGTRIPVFYSRPLFKDGFSQET